DDSPRLRGCVVARGMRREHDANGVILDVRRDHDVADETAPGEDLLPVHDALGRCLGASHRAIEHVREVLPRGEADEDLEEEAVELRLRKRVGAVHLEGVLGRHDEEWLLEPMHLATDGDASLLHGLEERRLRLRRRAVDLIGEDHLGEDRPTLELEGSPAAIILHDDLRADDICRHEVGGELDPPEAQVEHLAERPHEERLSESGDSLEKTVSTREESDEHLLDDLLLADDDTADLAANALEALTELVGALRDGFGVELF